MEALVRTQCSGQLLLGLEDAGSPVGRRAQGWPKEDRSQDEELRRRAVMGETVWLSKAGRGVNKTLCVNKALSLAAV